MPTVYDLLPDDVRSRYPADRLTDRARQALSTPLPAGYPADRAARLAQRVAGALPNLTRSFGGGASWEEPSSPVRQFVAGLGDVVPSLAPSRELASAVATGLAGTPLDVGGMHTMKKASLTEPAPSGAAEGAARLGGNIIGFGAGTAALGPLVGETGALALTAAGPEGSIKDRAISAATTAAAGKVAGLAGEKLAPLLSGFKAAGVPGHVAAYVISHLPGSAAFGALQPVAQAAIRRMTGEPNAPMPTPQEMLEGAGKLAAAGLVMGLPGAVAEGGVEVAARAKAGEIAKAKEAADAERAGAIKADPEQTKAAVAGTFSPQAGEAPSPELAAALEHVAGGGVEAKPESPVGAATSPPSEEAAPTPAAAPAPTPPQGAEAEERVAPSEPVRATDAEAPVLSAAREPGAEPPAATPSLRERSRQLPIPEPLPTLPGAGARLPVAEMPEGYSPPGNPTPLAQVRVAARSFADGIAKVGKEITDLANPLHSATADESGRRGVDTFMEEKGLLEHRVWRTRVNQRALEVYFDTLGKPEVMDYLDRMEGGAEHDPVLAPMAAMHRERLDAAIQRVMDFKPGAAFIDNFFPHIWKDPKKAEQFFAGRRTGEGNRSFLKKRVLSDIREGLNAGLELASWNPETLVQTYEHNVAKFVMYQRLLQRYGDKFYKDGKVTKKGLGLLKYVRVGGKVPDGYVKLDPRWAQVYLNPEIPVSEWVDKATYETLRDAIQKVGGKFKREMHLPEVPGVLGYSLAAPGQAGTVATRFGTPLDVMAHELGHAIDSKYGMQDKFIRKSTPEEKRELRALADLRWEGQEASQWYKEYVRKGAEKMAALLQAYVHMPERMKEVAPKNYAKLQLFLSLHPELRDLASIKPSLVHEQLDSSVRAPGMVVGGAYYAPEGLARILNNHESRDHIMGSSIGRGAMATRNHLNMIQLGVSGFHATGVTLLASMSMMGTGLGDLMAKGRRVEGARKVAKSLVPTLSAVEYRKAGGKMLALDPEMVQWAFTGGMTLQEHPEYKNQVIDHFLRNANKAVSGNGALAERAKSAGRAAALAPFATLAAPMRLLTDHYIPQIKVAAFADEFSSEIARRAADIESGKITKEELARRTWANIDDRFGLLNYDNLFWNRTLKTAMMVLHRAPGWTHGTQRALGGAAFIDMPRAIKDAATGRPVDLTPRMRFALAMVFQTLAIGGAYHFLHTRRRPETLEDYLSPETGTFDPNGQPIRVNFPTYMKDVRGWAEDPIKEEFGRLPQGRGASSLFHGGKLAPQVTAAIDLLENQSYRGPIRKPGHDAYQQAGDIVKYLFGTVTPFSISNAQKIAQGSMKAERIESFFGIVRAPHHKSPHVPAESTHAVPYRRPGASPYRRAAGGSR